ncbi:MAG: hypothetical protein ACE5GN_04505 [Waddliaceae bacterium]
MASESFALTSSTGTPEHPLFPGASTDLQLASESDGRQFVHIDPELEELFGNDLAILAQSQRVNRTVRGGLSHLFMSITNPEYVQKVNHALGKLDSVLHGNTLSRLDRRMKDLFLARALQWTDEIDYANKLNGITDFGNRKMNALQHRLIREGASRKYSEVLNFFEEVAKIAFQDTGPRFRYPSFRDIYEPKKTDANGILKLEGGNWLLVPASTAPDQKAVFDKLNGILQSLKDFSPEGIPAKLREEELFWGLALVGQIMTNYLKQMDEAPLVSNQVFTQLSHLYRLLRDHLLKRKERELNIRLNQAGLEDFKDTFGALCNVLRKSEFAEFYSKGDKVALLQAANHLLTPFITFHLTPERLTHNHNWTIICENKAAGVHIYKTPEVECSGERELVVFFGDHNSFWEREKFNAFAFLGGRGTEFGLLNGLVHEQSLTEASKARRALDDILQARHKEIGEFSKIRFVGYGLDGTIAQLVGFDYKIFNKGKDVMIIGCGVPPFLDQEAAAAMGLAMRNMKGFHCINYAMAGDPNMRNLGVTGPFGMAYDNSAFINVTVPHGALFAGERATGDTRKAYMQMLSTAQSMHFAMREVYLQSDAAYELLENVEPMAEPLPAVTHTPRVEEVDDGQSPPLMLESPLNEK